MSRKNVDPAVRRALPTHLIWLLALAFCAFATAEAVALTIFSSMKSTNLRVQLRDAQTGTTSGLPPGVSAALTPAVTRALLMQYLRARETFDETDIRQNYAKVLAWSGPQIANEYRRLMARANPESPLSLYPSRTIVSTRLKTITFLAADTALLRFEIERQDGGNRASPPTPYTSVISFKFTARPTTAAELNPLGFQVTTYTRNADADGLAALPTMRR